MSKLPITKIAQEACKENIKAAPFKMYVNSFSASNSQVVANEGMSNFSKGLDEGDKYAKNVATKTANPNGKSGDCGEGFVKNQDGECEPVDSSNDLTKGGDGDPNAIDLDQ